MGATTRVLFVNPGLAMGGAEHSLLLLLEGLRARGADPVVAVFGEGPFQDRLLALGFPARCVAPPGLVRGATRYRWPASPMRMAGLVAAGMPTVLRLATLARRGDADLIHTNGMKAHLLGGLAGRLTGIPVVWHQRDFPPTGFPGRIFRIAAWQLPALILTNSDAVARAIQDGQNRNPRVERIYNAVDLDRFHPGLPKGAIRRELGLGDGASVVGMVAHLTPWKGHELFLEIARSVSEEIPEAHFVIAGGPIYETDGHAGYFDKLCRRAHDLDLVGRIAFLGSRDDIPEVLADLDVLVHCPTAPEPFGRVVAEAMAVGCPVLAPRFGGIPELVEDGLTGFLVPPGDAKAFAGGVIRLLKNPALGNRLREAGRRRAEKLFGVEAHVTAVLKAYQSILTIRRDMR